MTDTTEAPRPGACVILAYYVSTPLGEAHAEYRCKTHKWCFGPAAMTPDQCPLGQIERAAETVIARINATNEECMRRLQKWESEHGN